MAAFQCRHSITNEIGPRDMQARGGDPQMNLQMKSWLKLSSNVCPCVARRTPWRDESIVLKL